MVSVAVRHHKRVQLREWLGKTRPGVLEAIRNELVRALEKRTGSVWLRVKDAAVIAGYSKKQQIDGRTRALRSDAAASLLAFAGGVLGSTDIRTGFVGAPRPGGGAWKRHALDDLCQLAFGAQADADLRRGQRAWDVMLSLGWVWPAKQVRQAGAGEGAAVEFRSEAAVRRVNLDRLAQMTGLAWMLARDRSAVDAAKGDPMKRLRKAVEGPQRAADAALPPASTVAKAGHEERASRPPRPSDPRVARAALAAMKQIFD